MPREASGSTGAREQHPPLLAGAAAAGGVDETGGVAIRRADARTGLWVGAGSDGKADGVRRDAMAVTRRDCGTLSWTSASHESASQSYRDSGMQIYGGD